MRSEASVSSSWIPSRAVEGSARRAATSTSIPAQARARPIARMGAVVAAALIEAVLILGLVLSTLGSGAEGTAGRGPDRPQPPTTPAPAPGH